MLNGIHGHQDIERVVYGRPAGTAVRAEAERLGAKRVFVTTTKSVAQSALLADVIKELGDRYAGVYAGISDARHGIKESFGHRLIVPRVIVLDPAATLATPMDLMLSTGLKAVDHAVERLCSQQANPFALGTSTEALKLLTSALPAHKENSDDREARMNLQFGMWLSIGAGTSGVGVGASHGIGHVLGAACHVPHGHTSCVMLPSVLRWNLPANADRQKRVSEAFGKPDVPAADLVANLVATLGLPGRLSEVGVGKDRFREIAEKSMHDRAVLNNPRPIKGPAEVMEILELAA